MALDSSASGLDKPPLHSTIEEVRTPIGFCTSSYVLAGKHDALMLLRRWEGIEEQRLMIVDMVKPSSVYYVRQASVSVARPATTQVHKRLPEPRGSLCPLFPFAAM
jgi:hypothetical protein